MDKVRSFFTVKKPYPEWAYATKLQKQGATLIDMILVYPAAYLYMRYTFIPELLASIESGVEIGFFGELMIDFYVEGFGIVLRSLGWWGIPALLLMMLGFLSIPLVLYNFILEASPLKASVGKCVQGFWVRRRNGDPITIWDAFNRMFERLLILGHLLDLGGNYIVVKRNAPRLN